jgi:hypothetical protein
MPRVPSVRRRLPRSARPALAALAVLATAGTLATPALAGDVNLNFYPISGRSLDQDLWSPVEDQYAFGGTVDFGEKGFPLHFALGVHGGVGVQDYSNPLLNDAASTVSEISFGAAGAWQSKSRLRGYVAGGLSFVGARLEVDTLGGDLDDEDDSLGGWVEAGMAWRMGRHFSLGFGGRALFGTDITLFGVQGDADYFEFGPLLGWSWPAR